LFFVLPQTMYIWSLASFDAYLVLRVRFTWGDGDRRTRSPIYR